MTNNPLQTILNTPQKLSSPIELLSFGFKVYRAHFWTMIGFSSWLFFPAIGTFLLHLIPGDASWVYGLMIMSAVIDFFLTFWIGILLICLIETVSKQEKIDNTILTKQTSTLLQPTIRTLLFQYLAIALGFIALIIPGFIALVWFAFAQTSTVLDQKQGKQALLYSRELVLGRFFPVLYRLIAGSLMIGMIGFMVASFLIFLIGSLTGFHPTETTQITNLPPWIELIQSCIGIFLIPLFTIYFVFLYKELQGKPLQKYDKNSLC